MPTLCYYVVLVTDVPMLCYYVVLVTDVPMLCYFVVLVTDVSMLCYYVVLIDKQTLWGGVLYQIFGHRVQHSKKVDPIVCKVL